MNKTWTGDPELDAALEQPWPWPDAGLCAVVSEALEAELLLRAIRRADAGIRRLETALAQMNGKQIRRTKELAKLARRGEATSPSLHEPSGEGAAATTQNKGA